MEESGVDWTAGAVGGAGLGGLVVDAAVAAALSASPLLAASSALFLASFNCTSIFPNSAFIMHIW